MMKSNSLVNYDVLTHVKMRDLEIKVVKPEIWNFEVIKGKDAWREVVYSARMSGVPPQVKDRSVFRMIVENDYSSALEHIIIKFDLKMSKGNSPEFLEHRMISHTGYSTRYIEVSKGIDKNKEAYEVILPFHLIKEKRDKIGGLLYDSVRNSIRSYKEIIDNVIASPTPNPKPINIAFSKGLPLENIYFKLSCRIPAIAPNHIEANTVNNIPFDNISSLE